MIEADAMSTRIAARLMFGQGAVVMANANFTRPLATEILESVARECEWQSYPQSKQLQITAMPRAVIAAAVGTYTREDERRGDAPRPEWGWQVTCTSDGWSDCMFANRVSEGSWRGTRFCPTYIVRSPTPRAYIGSSGRTERRSHGQEA